MLTDFDKRPTKHPTLFLMGVLFAIVAFVTEIASIFAADLSHQLRDSSGAVACIVTRPEAGPGSPDRLVIHMRVPDAPAADVLATLPPELRDFSTLPVKIGLLVPNEAGSGAPVERLPTSLGITLSHPVIDGAPSATAFATATFPRTWVVTGSTVIAERGVRAPTGVRVTSQSRCQITAADAAQWQ